jgi:hypothetical protein
VLCKIVGVYEIGIHDKVAGKGNMEQIAVMQNIFYDRKISQIFDLKGSLRGRFASHVHRRKGDGQLNTSEGHGGKSSGTEIPRSRETHVKNSVGETESYSVPPTLLDGGKYLFNLYL